MLSNIISCDNSNITNLRTQYSDGLHFVVGDIHGEWKTLEALMNNILFDPEKDHVFFVGDYNAGGNVRNLLAYISNYYSDDYQKPGFHLIRGNHERELGPEYPLPNQPDIIVIRQKQMNYYIAHAGMLHKIFKVINEDINSQPDKEVFAYKLEDDTVCFDAPLRQIIWSRNGLYSQRSRWHNWPTEEELTNNHACILHGHTPYCFFMGRSYFSYGDLNLFWENQHVFFSEDLQSFDLDSNIKGLYKNGETYRGLTCVCLEVLEEVAANNSGRLTREGITNTQNGLFYAEYTPCWSFDTTGDISKVLYSSPAMKTIGCDDTYGVVIK